MSDRGKGAKEGAYICVSASLSTCVPWGIVKQMQHILCQPHHTTLMKKWQICLSLCLSPTHIDTNIPRQSPNVFLSALEQPVKQATGKITLFSLLGKNFEMCYIINIWLEDATLLFSPISVCHVIFLTLQYSMHSIIWDVVITVCCMCVAPVNAKHRLVYLSFSSMHNKI